MSWHKMSRKKIRKIEIITTDNIQVCSVYYQKHAYGFAVTLRGPSRVFPASKVADLKDYSTT